MQTSMEIGSLAVGGYGLVKGGIKGVQLVTLPRQMEKFAGNLALKGIESASQEAFISTLKARIAKLETRIDLNALSRAGQVLDRCGLTKAGRALDKHGGRSSSVFPKASGTITDKNIQGQWHLDDILTHPFGFSRHNNMGGIDYYRPDGSGVRYFGNGQFRGFLEPRI